MKSRKKALFIKPVYQLIAASIPNATIAVVKRSLNSVFIIIVSLSRTSIKEIPPNYQKFFEKPLITERISVLNGAS